VRVRRARRRDVVRARVVFASPARKVQRTPALFRIQNTGERAVLAELVGAGIEGDELVGGELFDAGASDGAFAVDQLIATTKHHVGVEEEELLPDFRNNSSAEERAEELAERFQAAEKALNRANADLLAFPRLTVRASRRWRALSPDRLRLAEPPRTMHNLVCRLPET
jgi:hypothetical protein